MTRSAPRPTGTVNAAENTTENAAEPVRGFLEGAAFVLLCLWTRTSPDRLRDELSPDAGTCAALSF